MSYLELTADQVDENSPIDAPLMGGIRDNQIYLKAEKVERDGSIPLTGDLYAGNNNLRQVARIYLSDGTVFPDDYLLEEGQSMIGAAFLGGTATSAGNGIVNDSAADFDGTDGVNTTHLVNVPGVANELMFQLSAVATNALTLKTSNLRATGTDLVIPDNVFYSVHSSIKNVEMRLIHTDTLTEAASPDTTVHSVHTSSRFLKLEIIGIGADQLGYNFKLDYGTISALIVGDSGDDVGGEDSPFYVYLRTARGTNDLTVTLTSTDANYTIVATVNLYESVDVTNAELDLILETATNA